MEELKPCPFCGGKAELVAYSNPSYFYSVHCAGCGCHITRFKGISQIPKDRGNKKEERDCAFKNQDSTIAAWNRRETEKEPAARER